MVTIIKSRTWLAAWLIGLSLSGLSLAGDDMSHEAIAERLRSPGTLCVKGQPCTSPQTISEANPTPQDAMSANEATTSPPQDSTEPSGPDGAAAYRSGCQACHDPGIAGAPRTGDSAAWQVRREKGMATLYEHAIHGLNAMPPKGGNPGLSDAEVKAAVDYMLEASP